MKLTAREQLTQFAHILQMTLFPLIGEQVGELSGPARLLAAVLEMVNLDASLGEAARTGRPREDRRALAAAFIAKAIYGCITTRALIEQLAGNSQMRRLCGWPHAGQLPHESTFSRSFAEFARTALPQRLHEALILATQQDRIVGHISRDSTAIEARERFPETARRSAEPADCATKQRSRNPKRPKRATAKQRGTLIERQRHMSLPEMLAGLSKACAIGVKKSSRGHLHYWRGYKLHLDVADAQIPISAVLTGANVHDANVAIPLMKMTAGRVISLYDVMDSAYDANAILKEAVSMNHVPIVQPHPRRNGKSKSQLPKIFPPKQAPEMTWAQQERYKERTAVERVHARLKDEFGGRHVRVRGATKVFAHLAFGLLALTVDQLLKLVVS